MYLRLDQENCYFFCSLIQQHLGAENDGRFVFGILPYPDLAQTVRDRVKERIRQFYNMPLPYSVRIFQQVSR